MEEPSLRVFPRWPSFAVLLGSAAFLTVYWDSIPARWIIHWGARGEPNGWATRSIPGVYGLLALGALIVSVNDAIGAIRPGTTGSGPAMRAATVDCMRIISFGVAVTMALLAIDLPLGPHMTVPALLALGLAPLVIAMGVGFTRLTTTLRRERESGRAEKVEGYHGLYYANVNDRRLWVPKLNGMGWTINFSHPLGWPMMVLILLVPVVVVAALYGEKGTAELLVFSQVILSMQLPFAVIPLLHFVSSRKLMGEFALGRKAKIGSWSLALLILLLNATLIFETL